MKKLTASLLLFLLLGTVSVPADERLILNTTHQGAVTHIKTHTRWDNVFTCGKDGQLIIWDRTDLHPVHRLTVSNGTIHDLILNPAKPQAAIVIPKGNGAYIIDVWDWESETLNYSIDLTSRPRMISFSNEGQYLYFSAREYSALQIYDTSTGRKTDLLNTLRDEFSLMEIDESRNRLFGYSSGGTLYSWRGFKSGSSSPEIRPSLPGISQTDYFRIDSVPYLIGKYQDNAVIIDGRRGRELADISAFTGLKRLSFDRPSLRTGIISQENGQDRVSYWQIIQESGKTLFRLIGSKIALPDSLTLTAFHFDGSTGWFGDIDGNLLLNEPGETRFKTLTSLQELSIQDISASGDSLVMLSNEYLIFFQSPFVSSESPQPNLWLRNRLTAIPHENSGRTNLAAIDNQRALVWESRPTESSFEIYDISGNLLLSKYYSQPILDIHINAGKVWVVQNDRETSKVLITVFSLSEYKKIESFYLSGEAVLTMAVENTLLYLNNDGVDSFFRLISHPLNGGESTTETPFAAVELMERTDDGNGLLILGTLQDGRQQVVYYSASDLHQSRVINTKSEPDSKPLLRSPESGTLLFRDRLNHLEIAREGMADLSLDTDSAIRNAVVHNGVIYLLTSNGHLQQYIMKDDGFDLIDLFLFNDLEWLLYPRKESWIIPSRGIRNNPETYFTIYSEDGSHG